MTTNTSPQQTTWKKRLSRMLSRSERTNIHKDKKKKDPKRSLTIHTGNANEFNSNHNASDVLIRSQTDLYGVTSPSLGHATTILSKSRFIMTESPTDPRKIKLPEPNSMKNSAQKPSHAEHNDTTAKQSKQSSVSSDDVLTELPKSIRNGAQLKRNRFGGTIKVKVPGTTDEFLMSDCQGRRKALFIGCNYTGQENELKGCINDCHNMAAFIMEQYGFPQENMLMLTDDQEDPEYQPTAENIIGAMHWLVHDSAPGDSLFLHFSGHGVSIVDEDGDEADGFDEAICPVDYVENGVIIDDMLHDILIRPLQPGVRLTAVFDCCHSGTALDLPYTYMSDGKLKTCNHSYRREAARAFVEVARGLKTFNAVYAAGQLMEGIKLLRKRGDNKDAQRKTEETRTSLADVIMFSGCRDDQTSADIHEHEEATGALSNALIAALREESNQSYTQLLKSIRRKMKGQFIQVPQLSTGHPMDMNMKFVM